MTIDLDTAVLDDLDFEPVVPCEHSGHDSDPFFHEGDGWALVRVDESCCNKPDTFEVICQKLWVTTTTLGCTDCNTTRPRDEFWTIISYV